MIQNSFLSLLTSWIENNHSACLVIVISTWGSSPRQPGALMLVRDDLHIEGSVSGGCVEGEVIRLSQVAMEDGKARIENFGIAVVQGSAFGLEGFFRISYATSMENLEKAMNKIKEFCESLN